MKYLITSALPYANGPLHFGHIAGVYLPADVYTRHRKLQGHKAIHISGSDEHGVAIMLNAQNAKKDYQSYVDEWHENHKALFKRYDVEFDFFGQTSKPYHHEEVLTWFKAIHKEGFIGPKDEQQLQCQDCHNYLPDRFVEGTCYVCNYEKARGDECPNCGTWIEPIKLKNPICKICSSKNIKVASVTQWYLEMSKYHQKFRDWFRTKTDWRKTVIPYVDSLSKEGLHDRAITRDLDWGIDVPLPEAKGKKLYVWFDAPIGYVSNTKEYLKQIGSNDDYLKDWWKAKAGEVEISHFIGKDNIIFHTIIFPVMGMMSGIINPPSQVPANQYVNLEGRQFSKSQGWYVDSEEAINEFGADALRYYLINLIPETADSSFTWKGFEAKVNNELANNIGNLVSRCLKFFEKNWANGLESVSFAQFESLPVTKKVQELNFEIQKYLDHFEVKRALEVLMQAGQEVNTYFSDQAPWAQMKTEPEKAAETIANTSTLIAWLGVLFQPFLPGLSLKILSSFGAMALDKNWQEKVYKGDIGSLKSLSKNGLKLAKATEALVPKIDSKRIDELNNGLQAKLPKN